MELIMNSATMDFKIDSGTNDLQYDDEDALSFRDFQLYDHTDASSTRSSPRTSTAQELFEFFPTLSTQAATGDIVFGGKVIIPASVDEGNDRELIDKYQNGDYLTLVGSSSFRLPERRLEDVNPIRSVSNRDLGSLRHAMKFSTSAKKVNITALTSMSSKSRRRMFMFGPVKFMPEMEMSAIRERQGRRNPSRMFPVAEGGDASATGKVVAGRNKNQRVTVKSLSCRARLNTVFERSLGCLRI